jgi:hypothetical protein
MRSVLCRLLWKRWNKSPIAVIVVVRISISTVVVVVVHHESATTEETKMLGYDVGRARSKRGVPMDCNRGTTGINVNVGPSPKYSESGHK